MQKICSKCVMDTSDPNIKFDENIICDHCHDFETSLAPHWDTSERGRQDLQKILDNIKQSRKDSDFDCLLGISGGVDSSYMLHLAVKEFGLKPLVFHVDGGWNSELAVHNINVMIDKLGLDLYTEVINWEEMKDFQLAFFKAGVPHLDIPQDHAFIATLYNYASKYNIKYILNGGNYSTECVQYPMKYYYYGTDMTHNNHIRKLFGTIKMKDYPFSSIYRHKIYLKYIRRIQVVKPLNYIPFFKEKALDLLARVYSWKPYPQKHFESRFTRFLEGYWLPERFGFDPRRVMFSSLILTGQMSRQTAMDLLQTPAYDKDLIEDDIDYIAKKLGITHKELTNYFNMPRKYYWNYRNQQHVFRIGAKVLNMIGLEKVKKRTK